MLVPPTHPDCSGHGHEMERISRGSQIRSASGQKWAHLTLSKLLQIRCDPEVATVMEELAALTECRFSSKEVRQKGEKQDDFKSKLARAIELMRVLTAHYSDWRAAFAAFQSRIFNVRGTLACIHRQEKMRGRVDDPLLDYIKYTTEHFVSTRIDGSAPTSLVETPPFKSATAATFDILLLFWKDFQMGVLWMLTDDSADLMSDVQPSPLAAVPKKDPATLLLTGDLRVVHAHNIGEHSINERTPRSRHPPAACPQHVEVVLYALWLKACFPGLAIGAAKLDVRMAFRNRLTHLADANWFATQFPGDEVGTRLITAIWGGLTFGWTESPGEYGVVGWAISQAHCRSAPPKSDEGSMPDLPFWNSTFVDDGVVVDLLRVGGRAHYSRSSFLAAMCQLFSDAAPSFDKIETEGTFAETLMLWGLWCDFEQELLCLPETKLLRALALLQLPQHAVGQRRIPYKQHLALASYFQYIGIVVPAVLPYVSMLWNMCQTETAGWIDPVGDAQAKARAWAELDEAKVTLKLVLELARQNPSLTQVPFRFVIDAVDAANLPDADEVIVVGSDADGFDEADGGVISAGDLSSGHIYLGFGEEYVCHFQEDGGRAAQPRFM